MDPLTIFSENGIYVNIKNTVVVPKKNEINFNPNMINSRCLALYALGAYIESQYCLNKTVRCLDALGATGVAGLSWVKNFPQVQVTINDPSEAACSKIKDNEQLNKLNVEITQNDVNVLLLQKAYDFVFLDCYGSSVHYIDSLFRNVPKHSILVITSTDDAALYGKVPDVTLRNYGSYIAKTYYSKELASRLIIAAVVRAAAKCGKGVEVMCSVAVKSHITLVIKVTRGPAIATHCVSQIRKLLHCCICEDRVFLPHSIHPIEHPYSLLSCDCRVKSVGHVAVELGPVWSGPIFDSDFCVRMLKQMYSIPHLSKTRSLLTMVVTESLGGHFDPGNDLESFIKERAMRQKKLNHRKGGGSSQNEEGSSKKQKIDLCPPFYYNLHRHSPKGYDLRKLKDIVKYIQNSNFLASRTHFDSEAIRTSASLAELDNLLISFAKQLPRR